jgi:hypothetical protein
MAGSSCTAITLFIASILLLVRPNSTRVQVDLHVDESFAIAERQVLSVPSHLSAPATPRLGKIQFPRALGTEESNLATGRNFESGISLVTGAEGQVRGEVSLPESILPAQTRVLLENRSSCQYWMALKGLEVDSSEPQSFSPGIPTTCDRV